MNLKAARSAFYYASSENAANEANDSLLMSLDGAALSKELIFIGLRVSSAVYKNAFVEHKTLPIKKCCSLNQDVLLLEERSAVKGLSKWRCLNWKKRS